MVLSTDFHSHILPGIDDGCATVEDSVKLIRREWEQGVKTIMLTPHFYPHQMYPDVFLANRQNAMDQLNDALAGEVYLPQLIMGAEVHYSFGMSQWEQLKQLTLGNTSYILIEMPSQKWDERMYEELECIHRDHGLTPIIAHIERSFRPFNTREHLRRLSALPVLLQGNCSFLTEKRTRHIALRLVKEQKIHLFGSDCHGIDWRPPSMAAAREILIAKLDKQTHTFLEELENVVLRSKLSA